MLVVDTFIVGDSQGVSIEDNERSKGLWDLNELNGFVNIRGFDVRDDGSAVLKEKISRYLYLIYCYIYALKTYIADNFGDLSIEYPDCVNEMEVFVITPHTVQEITNNRKFNGINKPKNIVQVYHLDQKFRLDNRFRAGRRHIMLHLRQNGSPRPWMAKNHTRKSDDVKNLVLHELAHSLCNHCVYRDEGNHSTDFKKCENLLHDLTGSSAGSYTGSYIESVAAIENELTNIK